MNIESNDISQCRRKGPFLGEEGPHNMAVALQGCFVTGSLLCKGVTV